MFELFVNCRTNTELFFSNSNSCQFDLDVDLLQLFTEAADNYRNIDIRYNMIRNIDIRYNLKLNILSSLM